MALFKDSEESIKKNTASPDIKLYFKAIEVKIVLYSNKTTLTDKWLRTEIPVINSNI